MLEQQKLPTCDFLKCFQFGNLITSCLLLDIYQGEEYSRTRTYRFFKVSSIFLISLDHNFIQEQPQSTLEIQKGSKRYSQNSKENTRKFLIFCTRTLKCSSEKAEIKLYFKIFNYFSIN